MQIRLATEEDYLAIATVHVESWKETYQGIISEEYLSRLSITKRGEIWQEILKNPKPSVVHFVAVNTDDKIIGFADGGPCRDSLPFDGELYAIYLLKEYQKQGIGRLLFNTLTRHLVNEGFHSMMIWVLKDNPTLKFYLHLGGGIFSSKKIEIGGKHYDELSVGWSQL